MRIILERNLNIKGGSSYETAHYCLTMYTGDGIFFIVLQPYDL